MPYRLRAWGRHLGSIRRDKRGIAAVEFAIIAPFLILLLLGGVELTKMIGAMRQGTNTANSIAQAISQNTTGTVTTSDLHFFYDSAMLLFPDVLGDSARRGQDWWTDIAIGMTGVSFVANPAGCTSGCTYVPTVAWSGGMAPRPCTTLTQAGNGDTPTPTTLPADAFGTGFLIVVDVSYRYTPFIATEVFHPFTIKRSFYIQPRYVQSIQLQASDGFGTVCPGF